MNQISDNLSFFQNLNHQYELVMKQQKKKILFLKIKIFLTLFLPFFIFILFIKVAETFIQIQVRKIFTKPFHDSDAPVSGPVSAHMVPVTKEVISPEPVTKHTRK